MTLSKSRQASPPKTPGRASWRDWINTVQQGDCLELMKQMPDGCVDLVVTDPPYGIDYYSNYYVAKNPHDRIVGDDQLLLPYETFVRLLSPMGALFFFYSWKNEPNGIPIKNKIVWEKNNWSAGDLEGDFGNQYENIAFCPMPDFKIHGKRLPNVWHCDRVSPEKLRHPTEKPVPLIAKAIKAGSNPGDLILDPFAGSGTTLVACKQLSRRFIGFEINPKYVDICNQRLRQEVLKLETIRSDEGT